MGRLTTGQCMRLYRKRLGLSSDLVAKKINVTGRALLYWEKDQRIPSIFDFYNLTKVYKVTIEQLMGIDQPKLEKGEEALI